MSADLILHAGDATRAGVLDALARLAPAMRLAEDHVRKSPSVVGDMCVGDDEHSHRDPAYRCEELGLLEARTSWLIGATVAGYREIEAGQRYPTSEQYDRTVDAVAQAKLGLIKPLPG